MQTMLQQHSDEIFIYQSCLTKLCDNKQPEENTKLKKLQVYQYSITTGCT